MKKLITVLFLTIAISTPVFASAPEYCFGTLQTDESIEIELFLEENGAYYRSPELPFKLHIEKEQEQEGFPVSISGSMLVFFTGSGTASWDLELSTFDGTNEMKSGELTLIFSNSQHIINPGSGPDYSEEKYNVLCE